MKQHLGLMAGVAMSVAAAWGGSPRQTISLDGTWAIADGTSPDRIPESFGHTVPVPGLANLATPPFADVDRFTSRENLANRIRANLAPAEWMKEHWKGKVDQSRDWFWYRRTFRAPAKQAVALLRIGKAQFGTAVWLNGRKVGEYAGCFTAGHFRLEDAIRWGEENTLVIRVGAHPAVLPDTYPTGSDFEKIRWTPGIYDRVSLIVCDNPAIETVQVAPRIATGEALVQATVANRGATPVSTELRHTIRTWRWGTRVAVGPPQRIDLAPGETRTLTQTIRIPNVRLWSPEDPFLYAVESGTGGDSVTTRFGMREFRFDASTMRAHLNGGIRYLRGSNITLHRFFEDPLCRDLPWNDRWVRKLLVEVPRRMNWNYFRFCIGPVPDRWLEICDEEGILIQNEFFVWTGSPEWYKGQGYARTHDADEMIRQYRDWMRDNWNHPSVAVWDANNETKDPVFGDTIIPAVRGLDLSGRPWENSYNKPAAPDDPVEHHPYLMSSGYRGPLKFSMTQLETMDARPAPGRLPSETNPRLINEYGWLWLNRDGSPTLLTENVYAQLMGTNVTARERLDLYAYLLGAKTEYWRASRQYAGIVHFVYLTCSYPGVYTADHFADVRRLELDPAFADHMGEAFKPLGVYLNFFQPVLTGGVTRTFTVKLVNDDPEPKKGRVTLSIETRGGRELARVLKPFEMAGLGAASVDLDLAVPDAPGDCLLRAVASAAGDSTLSRRRVRVIEP
ncbi:MAG: hypothetical protein FJ221_13280 [Lentisphaerae bacterium]|nr:hypothetical protein [Lentisphaerota bacterium]